MKSGLRWVVAAVVVLHGLIHFLGAAKGFGWADVSQLKDPIGPPFGAAWLTAGALTVLAGLLIGARTRGWWAAGAVAAVASQAVIFTSWSDAKVATIVNVALLAGVAYGYLAQRPASRRAIYRAQLKTAISRPLPAGAVTESDVAAQLAYQWSGPTGREPNRRSQ